MLAWNTILELALIVRLIFSIFNISAIAGILLKPQDVFFQSNSSYDTE